MSRMSEVVRKGNGRFMARVRLEIPCCVAGLWNALVWLVVGSAVASWICRTPGHLGGMTVLTAACIGGIATSLALWCAAGKTRALPDGAAATAACLAAAMASATAPALAEALVYPGIGWQMVGMLLGLRLAIDPLAYAAWLRLTGSSRLSVFSSPPPSGERIGALRMSGYLAFGAVVCIPAALSCLSEGQRTWRDWSDAHRHPVSVDTMTGVPKAVHR